MSGCKTPFVRILELPVTAAEDYDYGPTAALLKGQTALAGVTFIEYGYDGQRHLGARVPDTKVGAKLVAALRGGIKPAPKLVCFDRPASRGIDIDLVAGTVKSVGAP